MYSCMFACIYACIQMDLKYFTTYCHNANLVASCIVDEEQSYIILGVMIRYDNMPSSYDSMKRENKLRAMITWQCYRKGD